MIKARQEFRIFVTNFITNDFQNVADIERIPIRASRDSDAAHGRAVHDKV